MLVFHLIWVIIVLYFLFYLPALWRIRAVEEAEAALVQSAAQEAQELL